MTRIHGVIHGRIIELDGETDLPEGQAVSVIVQPVDRQSPPPGEGLRLSAGARCAASRGCRRPERESFKATRATRFLHRSWH